MNKMENTVDNETQGDALALKERGNALIKEGNFKEAALLYTQSIKLDPTNSSLYSNRSLAYLRLKLYSLAFQDALETIRLNPQWAKGYFRKAEVEAAVGLTEEAALSYTQTLQLQPQDVASVLNSIKKVTDEQKKKREVRDKLPWVCCCVGVIIGVLLVILDYFLLDHEMPRNPLMQVGTILIIACASFGVARLYLVTEDSDGKKQLHPPGFQDPDAGREPWSVGLFCAVMIIFLDLTFIEVIGLRENPSKLLTLMCSIAGGGIGIGYLIYLIKYFNVSSSHQMTPVDCRIPYFYGSAGGLMTVIGFVLDYAFSEEPSVMSPLLKASIIFAVSCVFWCIGKCHNLSEIFYNCKIHKNFEDSGILPDSLWCAGLILGTFFIIIDCTVANVIGLRESPMKTIGFALSIAGAGYGLGSLLEYMKSFEKEKQEDSSAQDFQPVSEDTQVPEKISNKYTKAQARYRYKKGKM